MASILRSFVFRRNVLGFLRMGNVTAARQIWPIRLYSEDRKEFDLAVHMQSMEEKAERYRKISRHDIDKVLEQVKNGKEIKPRAVKQLIECFGNRLIEELPDNRIKLVDTTFKTLLDLPISLDIGHYNSKLKVYCENEHVFSPSEFRAELEERGIAPNRETFEYFIEFYARIGETDEIIRTIDVMKARDIGLSMRIYGSLILGHGNAGNLNESKQVIQHMKQSGIVPDESTYLCLLRVYAKIGDIDNILKELEIMRLENCYLEPVDYFELAYDLAVNDHDTKIDRILSGVSSTSSFNSIAANVVIRLLNKGKDDAAWKIFKIMPTNETASGETMDSGNFYINHLIKLNRPTSYICSVCDDMEREGLHTKAFRKLVAKLSEIGSVDTALEVLRHVKSRGWPDLVDSDFRPIFMADIQPSDVHNVLKSMTNEFGICPSFYETRNYIVSRMNLNNTERAVQDLIDVKMSPYCASASVVSECLKQNRLRDAVETAIKYNTFIDPPLLCDKLIAGVVVSKDFTSYVLMLRLMYEHFDKIKNYYANPEIELISKGSYDRNEMMGHILQNTIFAFDEAERSYALFKITKSMVRQGIGISNSEAARIEEVFATNMTDTVKKLLQKLSSGELKLRPIKKLELTERMRASQFEYLARKGNVTDENKLNTNLMRAYYAEGKLTQYEEMFQQLSDKMLTKNLFDNFFDLCVQSKEIDKAMQVLEQAYQKFPRFCLNIDVLLDAVSAFIDANRTEEAIEFLRNSNVHRNNKRIIQNRNVEQKCIRVMTQLSELGKVKELESVFEILLEKNYANISEEVLAPLVNVHLISNDIPKAIETFKRLAAAHRLTPLQDELIERFIVSNDESNLNIIVNESIKRKGDAEAISALFLGYLKQNRVVESKNLLSKLMEFDLGLVFCISNILNYTKHGSLKYIENFMDATNSVACQINREEVYYLLLRLYQRIPEPQKALDLWRQCQKNNENISGDFLIELHQLLLENGCEPPFKIPKKHFVEKSNHKRKINYQKSTDTKIGSSSYPKMEDNFSYRKEIGETGSTNEQFEDICKEFIAAENNSDLCNKFRLDGTDSIFFILRAHPEIVLKFEKVIDQCASDVTIPANILWCHYVSANDHAASTRIWTKYLQDSREIWYRSITRAGFKYADPKPIVVLIGFLKTKNQHRQSLKGAYSCLLNIYAKNGRLSDAMGVLDNIVAEGSLADVKFDDLTTLKKKVEGTGKVFPYELPRKTYPLKSNKHSRK